MNALLNVITTNVLKERNRGTEIMQVDPDQPCDLHRAILVLELDLVRALTLLSNDNTEVRV